MELTEALYSRRSVRKYDNHNIELCEIEEIIRAGTTAPSAKNRQPWFFYVINDEKTKNEFVYEAIYGIETLLKKYKNDDKHLAEIKSAVSSIKIAENASAIIIITHKKKYNICYNDDVNWNLNASDIEVTDILSVGAAVQNMLLKATDMGYGTLWVCDIFYAYPQIKKFLKTNDAILSAVYIGKSAEKKNSTSRFNLNEVSCLLNKEQGDIYE